MKKFLGLLLAFLMVFTMIPPIVGPAARADDTDTFTGEPPLEARFQDEGPVIDDDFDAEVDGINVEDYIHYKLYFDSATRTSRLDEWFDGVYNATYHNKQNIPIVSFNDVYPTKYFYYDGAHGLPVSDGSITVYINDMDPGDALNDRDVFNPDSLTCPDGSHATSERFIGTMPEEEQITSSAEEGLKLPEVDVYRTAEFLGWKPYDSSMPQYTANMAVSDFMTSVGIVLLIVDPPTTAIGAIASILSAGIAINDRIASLQSSGGDENCLTIATYRYTYRIVIDNCVEYTVAKDVDYLHGGKDAPQGEFFYRHSVSFPENRFPMYPELPAGASGNSSIILSQIIAFDHCENPWASYLGHSNSPDIAISWGVIDAFRYAYCTYGYHNCIDQDPVDSKCDYCGYPSHTYTNCMDNICNDCGFDRGPVSGFLEVDGHVYDDCYDLTCNRCNHTITEPHHAMSTPIWEVVGDTDICKLYVKFCTRSGCGYVEVVGSDPNHSYTDHTVNIGTSEVCQKHTETCSICDYSYDWYDNVHTWNASGWEPVGDENVCKVNTHFCTDCGFTETVSTDTEHNYTNCMDSFCNDCDYNRGSVAGYQLGGHVYSDCLDNTCERCGYTREYATHTWGASGWEPVGDANICRVAIHYCTRPGCGFSETVSTDTEHTYSDCADSICNDCGYNRSSVPGYLQGGHVYSDYCTDTVCNRAGCGYVRTAPGHSWGASGWEPVGTSGVCRISVHYCTRTACSAIETLSTDTSHTYSDCADRSCSVCDYSRSSVSGYLQSGHVYNDYCTDTTCNRAGCGYVRTAPGHSWGASGWEPVGTAGICRVSVHYCTRTACSVSETVSTDTSHTFGSWTNYSSTQHRHLCSTCDYYGYGSHTFSSWANYTSTLHRRTCSLCGRAETQSHTWVYVPGSGSVYRCSVCSAYK